ncbi:MAG TPA: carboxypeptidase regulatory-like domain-containing protein [Blastocatellia bacterium]|nr:carboxypeptidase regulatory-like domain-containing protein [Blastocatellia bacterium]
MRTTLITGRGSAMAHVCALLAMLFLTNGVFAQVSTSGRLTGTVTDSQGAVVSNAQINVKNNETQTQFTATTNKEGSWTLPSVSSGAYTVTITAQGFKTTVVQEVKVDVGQPTTVNAALETGGVNDQVVVTGGGEVLQTASANVSTTITGRQIHELPFSTRDALQLVLVMPGVQTPGTSRTSSVNGLPKATLNITLDGANIQDNFLKSTDGFFTTAQPKSDAVEEVTISTATPGAESAGGGAVQVRFVTKQGTNEFHGGLFWQHRNDALNASYFFNQKAFDNLPRDRIILNQFGGNVGGPIVIPKLYNGRDKAFFFVNMEEFRLPQTFGVSRTVLTDAARQGIFKYRDSTGAIRDLNLYQLAATGAGGRTYTSTPDATTLNALNLINGSVSKGVLQDRISTNDDYNRLNLTFVDPARNIRRFPTVRFDFNVTEAHHVEFVHNFQHYFSQPDGVNSIFSIYPGVGSVLGGDGTTGSIYRNTFTFAMAERWTIKSNLINEIRLTSSGNGTSNFRREFGPGQFKLFNGYSVTNPFTAAYSTYTGTSRRNTPVKTLNDNLFWVKGDHEINFGGSYTRVASWTQSAGNQLVPSITIGIAANDPINTGATSIFTTGNFPNSTAAQRTDAQNLYALLTGRISATTRGASFDGTTRKFELGNVNEYNHLYEVGLYAQDRWKISSSLTLTGGIRWEFDPSPINDNNVYTRTGPEGVFGVSGFGNLFKPGVYQGAHTQFRLLDPTEKAFQNSSKDFAPSIGFAWSPGFKSGMLGRVFGDLGKTVLRGGYSIAYVREGFSPFNSIFGSNEGVSFATGTSPANFPQEFGAPGSRLLRDGSYPFLPVPAPVFPFTARQGAAINDFDPNLRPGYVQSWTFGIQRELTKDMALEVRYVGNRATRLWGQYEIGEVNIFENGFLNEFKAAQENLRIFRQANPNCGRTGFPACNYGNSGLPGQVAIPVINTAIGSADLTTLTSIDRGEAGRVAASIAQNVTRMNALINTPVTAAIVKPFTSPDPNNPGQSITLSNFFVANPRSPTNSWLMDNIGEANYHALQVELRRRLSKGLLVQGSYVWAKSMSNTFNQSAASDGITPTTFRDLSFNKSVAPRDIRHGFKFDWIYELPFGPGRSFFNGGPSVLKKTLEGWQFSGVARIQSGTPTRIQSGRQTFNNRDSGVMLFNMTQQQLQEMVKIRKTSVCNSATGACQGVVYWLPQDVIDNTLAAFELGGKTLANLDPSKPYIGPPTTPGQLGANLFIVGPWTSRYDLALMKRTRITEKTNIELRAQFLNAFNQSSITIRAVGNNSDVQTIGTAFGQTRNAFRDFTVSGTNDPGGRLIEFQLRLNF